MAAGRDTALAAFSGGASGRRISASSFKLLTAKLKSGKPATPEPFASPIAEAQRFETASDFDAETVVEVATAPATDLPSALPVDMAELPAFQPLTVRDLPEPQIEFAPAFEAASDEPEPVEAASSYPDVLAADVIEVAAPVVDNEQESEPERALLPQQMALPEFTPVAWQSPAPAPEPEAEADADAPVVPFGIGMSADELPPMADLQALPEFVPEPFDTATDEIVDVPGLTVEQPADVTEEIFEMAPSAPAFEAAIDASPELVVESEAADALLVEAEVPLQDEPLEPEVLAEAPAELAPSDVLEAERAPETKSAPSEMAGRVVDAMIKTISTAIYAKPTSSERAAFLREVAILMQEAAKDDEGLARAHSEPVSQAAIPAARSAQTVNVTPAAPVPDFNPVTEAIAERIGPAPLLKTSAPQAAPDPFAQSAIPARLADPKPAETIDADEESGDLALTLLDMMSGGTGSLPHEKTLAADTLLRILPRIPVKQLLSVVERVAIMETPPALLVAKLIRDSRPEVVAPLLERCSHISDQDLMNAAPDGDTGKLRMVARRRILSTVLSDFLISTGEPGVLLTLIRNPGAALSHEAFFRLAEEATKHHGLLAPLATRADLPPPVAFELFWHVPQELRRFIFSRFLTDSETLNKILRITLTTHGNDGGDAMGDGKFPSRETMDVAISLAASYKLDEAARAFGEMAGIAHETTMRIVSDREGEPLTVLFKALGCTRARFEEAITRLRHGDAGVLRPDRHPDELQAIFDGLSFNKARILLTYWDWYMRKAGPYAPHN